MLRPALAAAALVLTLAGCSDSEGGEVPEDRSTPAEVAQIAAVVAAEVHEALGIADEVEVDDPVVEPCYDSLGRETGEVGATVHSRAAVGVVPPERFESIGERLGATDVRREDLLDPLDESRVIGQEAYLFADRGGRAVTVSMQITDDDGFVASVIAECP